MKAVRLLMVVLLVTAFGTTASAQKKADPTGTWSYEAPAAPYEYSKGDIIIQKDGKEFSAEMVLGEYYKTKAEEVKFENNELSFLVYVDVEAVNIKLTFEEEAFTGTASYSEGTIPITGKKKE